MRSICRFSIASPSQRDPTQDPLQPRGIPLLNPRHDNRTGHDGTRRWRLGGFRFFSKQGVAPLARRSQAGQWPRLRAITGLEG
jgi:hypothetical protein